MKVLKRSLFLMLAAALAFGLFGCEGEEGPQGPQGPPGEDGPQYTYLGDGGEPCMHCHATTVSTWEGTGHSEAYADLVAEGNENRLYCLKCHVTGFDSQVAYADTVITTYGPDTDGFDDYIGLTTDEAVMRRAALEGVQCEACHGAMGPDFNAHKPAISFATRTEDGVSLSICSPCHSGQLAEWAESGHGTVSGETHEEFVAHFGRSSCAPCHTSEGFIGANDPVYADYDFNGSWSFIGCVTCHDPHADHGDHQLRNLGDVEVAYYLDEDEIPTYSGYNNGQVCGKCHHARRDFANVSNQIANGTGHFGPHGSPQMDMFIGNGSYEIPDYTYEREFGHQNISDACVKCHMVRVAEIHGESQDHSFHTFQPDVGNCEPCHTGLANFDVNGVQTEILGKMNTIASNFGFADVDAFIEGWDSQADGVEPWQREVAYAVYFVYNDGSKGVHNYDYATSLLDNAIAYWNANSTF